MMLNARECGAIYLWGHIPYKDGQYLQPSETDTEIQWLKFPCFCQKRVKSIGFLGIIQGVGDYYNLSLVNSLLEVFQL